MLVELLLEVCTRNINLISQLLCDGMISLISLAIYCHIFCSSLVYTVEKELTVLLMINFKYYIVGG